MKFEYLLFDLDGTLTDPKEGITKSVQYALEAFGIEEKDLTKLEPFIGPPLIDSFMEFYGMDTATAAEAVKRYREYFAPTGIFQNALIEGVPEMLFSLKKANKKIALASSKPTEFVKKILEHFEIREYFDVIVGSRMDGTRTSKAEVVGEVLHRFEEQQKVDITRAVMIGDRKYDIKGAKEFDMTSVGVTFGYAKDGELEQAGADYVVSSVQELSELLLQ